MLNFKVRHVIPSSSGRRIVLGAFEGEAVVYDMVTRTLTGPWTLAFDFGGQRLALSDECDLIVVAAYHRHGIAGYRASTGEELWRRKDIKRVQRIDLSADGAKAYCGLESQSLVVLDVPSGKTITKIRAAVRVRENESGDVLFIDSTQIQLQTRSGKRLCTIPRMTEWVLDVCFAGAFICVAEMGGPLRFLETTTGAELWRYQPAAQTHVLQLAYDKAGHRIVGIQGSGHTLAKQLLHLSATDGTLVQSFEIGEPSEHCFAGDGRLLVLNDGRILETGDAHTLTTI